MTRDYTRNSRSAAKVRNSRRQPSRKTTPGWIWLTIGIFVGAIGTKVYDHQSKPIKDSLANVVKPSNNAEMPTPRFDFYTLLTENEEVIPNDPGPVETRQVTVEKQEKEIPSSTIKTTEAPKAEPQEVYVLQAGAFRNANDADSVRARLLLLNMQATVETVTPRPGETWHRVLVGPFSNTAILSKSRQVLQQNGIDSIQMKRRL